MVTRNYRITQANDEYLLRLQFSDEICEYLLVDIKSHIARAGEIEIIDDDVYGLIDDILRDFDLSDYEVDDDVFEEEAEEILSSVEGDIINDGAYAHLFTNETYEPNDDDNFDDAYSDDTRNMRKYKYGKEDDVASMYGQTYFV